jgi:Ca-activated chloride channel homolog
MIALVHPWAALLLPLPVLVYVLFPPFRQTKTGVRVPFFGLLARVSGETPESGAVASLRGRWQMVVLILCWLCTLLALTRPQRIEQPLHRDEPTRDLLLLIDLSASMDTRDFTDAAGNTVDRVTAVKEVLGDFLTHAVATGSASRCSAARHSCWCRLPPTSRWSGA